MRLVSWLLPTHYRPERFQECLTHLLAQRLPDGWELEVLVGHCDDDVPQVDDPRVRCYVTRSTRVGGRLTELLYRSRGEYIFVTGDDDWQDPNRTAAGIKAHSRGHAMAGLSCFMFQNFESGRKARYRLRDGYDPLIAGACMSYHRELLESVVGWPDTNKFIDAALRARIYQSYNSLEWVDVAHECPNTIFGDGNGNITAGRVYPTPGDSRVWGSYLVTGIT